jgi:DNA-binding YbaB/EbfC family protein
MFPGGGTPDMNEMLAQAQRLQQQLVQAQEELARTQVKGSAGGGLVTATVTGGGELLGLEIDPKACDPSDTETLADLVVAAVRDAGESAAQLQATTMGPLAEGFSLGGDDEPGAQGAPGLPGF